MTVTLRRRAGALACALALSASLPLAAGGLESPDRINLDGFRSAERFDHFIVKFREGSLEAKDRVMLRRVLTNAASTVAGTASAPLVFEHRFRIATGADALRTSRKLDRVEADRLLRALAAHPAVEYVELDGYAELRATPNDTYYGNQWYHFEAAGGTRANIAWDKFAGSNASSAVVAVIDSGITNHTDLAANVLFANGYDFVSSSYAGNDGSGRDNDAHDPGSFYTYYDCNPNCSPPTDPQAVEYSPEALITVKSTWHGTKVAGVLSAVVGNAKGIAGTAYGAKILPVRVTGKGDAGILVADLADAIVWSSGGTVVGAPTNTRPAKVLNISLGSYGACPATLQGAINTAVSRGSAVVVAVGNNNANAASYWPENCANVIAVAATDRSGNRASYSNYGTVVDLAAPGGIGTSTSAIYTTFNAGSTSPGAENYVYGNGASFAAPQVAAVAAMMLAKKPTLTPANIESILKTTARPLPGTCTGGCGAGIVDANAAVAKAMTYP